MVDLLTANGSASGIRLYIAWLPLESSVAIKSAERDVYGVSVAVQCWEGGVINVLCGALVAGLLFTSVVQVKTLTDAVTDESWVSYWIVDEQRVSGILHEFMLALDERLPEELQASHPLSPLRTQKLFREGQVQIECCVSQSWRSDGDQGAVSLWAVPMLATEEMLIFAPGRHFPC